MSAIRRRCFVVRAAAPRPGPVDSAGHRLLAVRNVVVCTVVRPDPAHRSGIRMRANTGVSPVRKRPNVGGSKSYCGSHAKRSLILCSRAKRPLILSNERAKKWEIGFVLPIFAFLRAYVFVSAPQGDFSILYFFALTSVDNVWANLAPLPVYSQGNN